MAVSAVKIKLIVAKNYMIYEIFDQSIESMIYYIEPTSVIYFFYSI